MKYDNLHGHKQEGDSQLQMDEGNNRAQYRRQLPLRTGKPLIPKISAATAAQIAINFAREWQQDPSAKLPPDNISIHPSHSIVVHLT